MSASGSSGNKSKIRKNRYVPPERYVPTAGIDPVEEEIKAYLSTPYIIGPIPDMFKSFVEVLPDMRQVTYDFPDDKLLGQEGITLQKLGIEDINLLGQYAIPMLSAGFTRSGAAGLFLLTYNLKAPGSDYTKDIFNGAEALESIGDKTFDDFTEKMLSPEGMSENIEPSSLPERDAAIYCYIAASTMRLFTKSADNYVKAWQHIVEGFQKFYGKSNTLRLATPEQTAIKGLSDWMSFDIRAKQTLYRILYMSNENENHLDLKRFLYDIHLSNTGIHLGPMFVSLCKRMNCDPAIMLTAIDSPEYGKQVRCLSLMMNLIANKNNTHLRRMWKYGRIFDETFMSDIQTKACPKLVCVFAEALKSEDPQTYSGVSQIAQLADVSDPNKRKCAAVAQHLLKELRLSLRSTTGTSNSIQRMPNVSFK